MFEHRKLEPEPDIQPTELTATDLADVSEVCLRTNADRCIGPAYSELGERELRALNGSFVLSCDGVDKLTDNYRKSCIKRLQKAHASLSRRWRGTLEFFPLRESDVQSTAPCVDFADKQTGELIDGWCWHQLQARIRYAWSPKTGD